MIQYKANWGVRLMWSESGSSAANRPLRPCIWLHCNIVAYTCLLSLVLWLHRNVITTHSWRGNVVAWKHPGYMSTWEISVEPQPTGLCRISPRERNSAFLVTLTLGELVGFQGPHLWSSSRGRKEGYVGSGVKFILVVHVSTLFALWLLVPHHLCTHQYGHLCHVHKHVHVKVPGFVCPRGCHVWRQVLNKWHVTWNPQTVLCRSWCGKTSKRKAS